MLKNNRKIIHYDHKEDVLAVYLKKGREDQFVEVAPGIVIEQGPGGDVIGIEVLDASKVLKPFLNAMRKRAHASAR